MIPVSQSSYNEFIFRIEASIVEIFLENSSLQIESDGLAGRHSLLQGEQFRYAKQ
ncbi:MAG: hypothetical protein SGI83_13090 [Bacteroidota bacterium]|nr:hypothetical protein [Bacteroidota bacterium]